MQAADSHAEGHEALLSTVMEVALETTALLVACFHDSRSRGAHLGELQPDFDSEACYFDRKGCGGDGAVEQVGPLKERGVM